MNYLEILTCTYYVMYIFIISVQYGLYTKMCITMLITVCTIDVISTV